MAVSRQLARRQTRGGRSMLATGPNQHWSKDFVHDQMLDGRAFRIFTVIDQWSRKRVSLKANFRLTGRCVGKALDEATIGRGWPKASTVATARNSPQGPWMNGPNDVA